MNSLPLLILIFVNSSDVYVDKSKELLLWKLQSAPPWLIAASSAWKSALKSFISTKVLILSMTPILGRIFGDR